MRVIVVGCEYTGVTTLIKGIFAWGLERGIHHHLDDHFTIPDAYHLSAEEQQGMLDMLPGIKERFQRFQIAYHVRLINKYKHILMVASTWKRWFTVPATTTPARTPEEWANDPYPPSTITSANPTSQGTRSSPTSTPDRTSFALAWNQIRIRINSCPRRTSKQCSKNSPRKFSHDLRQSRRLENL